MRIGTGYDVHAFANNRELWLGGILIEHSRGLAGHSDADVLIHAIMDALLGAAGLRDIGYYFPDNASEFKDIDSKLLLTRCITLVRSAGYEIGNIDSVIIAQQPRIAPHIESMRQTLAAVLGTDIKNINIKATTTEHLGFVGREEGIAAQAVVLLN